MIKLTKGVYRDVDTFLGVAKLERWDEGTALTQWEQARACGISYARLKKVVQAIKENPEWGLSYHSTQRSDVVARYGGSWVVTVVTFEGSPLADREVDAVRTVGDDTLKDALMRLVRGSMSMAAAWKRVDKRRQSGRDMKPYVMRTRSFLISMREQCDSDGDLMEIQEQIEKALALYGVHYDAEQGEEEQAA